MFRDPDLLLNIFTDGIRGEDWVANGSSVVYLSMSTVSAVAINLWTSFYTTECLAISRAMDMALDHPDRNVNIFSDSLSTVQALGEASLCSAKNPYLLRVRRKNVTLIQR